MISCAKALKGLLIVLAGTTVLAALFVGGCGAFGIHAYLDSLWRSVGDRYGFPELLGLVGVIALPIAAAVFGANVVLLWNVVRGGRCRPAVLVAAGATDVLGAIGAFTWITWFWHLEPWGISGCVWSVGAGLLALKGVVLGLLALCCRSSDQDRGLNPS